MHSRPLCLALQLGLFQLCLDIFGVLMIPGLLNRLLIQDIQVPAVLAAVAVGGQQLTGFTPLGLAIVPLASPSAGCCARPSS